MDRVIREYSKDDINDIINLGKNLHDNYKFNLDYFSHCMICEMNNIIVGFITYSVIYDRAEIIDIYVKENKRKNKVGSLLLSEVINNLNSSCQNITLEVLTTNSVAIKFYESFGFQKVSLRRNYKDKIDAYLMKKDLR